MQLNGTNGPIIMAASEPPEPPPRNPDKINASLKQITDSVSPAPKHIHQIYIWYLAMVQQTHSYQDSLHRK